MTASTPRIQRDYTRISGCTRDCNQGRQCTCCDRADMGTTLGADAAMDHDQSDGDPLGGLKVAGAVAAFAVFCAAVVAACF